MHDKDIHPKGCSSLSMDTRVYRVCVVEQFLKSGIPISKIDDLRSLLEEGTYRLTHSSHLAEYIPVIHEEEKKRIKREIGCQEVSAIFDGRTRLGEALAIVVRFFEGWSIQQRVVKWSMLAKSLF